MARGRRIKPIVLNDAVTSAMMGSLSQVIGVLRLSFAAVVIAGAVQLLGVVAWTPNTGGIGWQPLSPMIFATTGSIDLVTSGGLCGRHIVPIIKARNTTKHRAAANQH